MAAVNMDPNSVPPHPFTLYLGGMDKSVEISDAKLCEEGVPRSLDLDLGDEIANHNFHMLLKRRKGEIYQVVAGRLEAVSRTSDTSLQQLSRRFSYWWDRGNKEKEVQQVVTATLQKFQEQLMRVEVTRVHELVLKTIFSPNSPLCRMNRKVKDDPTNPKSKPWKFMFDRSVFQEGCPVEQILHPELEKRRQEHSAALEALEQANEPGKYESLKLSVEKCLFEHTYEEFLFGRSLGIRFENVDKGGSGGALYALDRFGRRIFVFKREDTGPTGRNNPKWYAPIKQMLVSPKPCLIGNSEPVAEVDAWWCDRVWGLGCVPPTAIRTFTFNGVTKKCSVQMYVDGCEQTLGEYVGMSYNYYDLPQTLLRWLTGSGHDTGLFYALGQREEKKQEVIKKLTGKPVGPPGAANCLDAYTVLDWMLEEIDGHLNNGLVRRTPFEETLWTRIFEKERSQTQKEKEPTSIKETVGTLFSTRENQKLLSAFFRSDVIEEGGVKERVSLIKIDSGSSNPHTHPESWDLLSLRFLHLLQVLPQFDEVYSEEAKNLIRDKEERFAHFLMGKAIHKLIDILDDDWIVKSPSEVQKSDRVIEVLDKYSVLVKIESFKNFWQVEANRSLFKQWIFEMDGSDSEQLRTSLTEALFKATKLPESERVGQIYYFNHHLKNRLYGSLQTRIDCFRVLRHTVTSRAAQKRDLFMEVKTRAEFERTLATLGDKFKAEFMDIWKKEPVMPGELSEISLSTPSLLEGLTAPPGR